jgi:hypothetical protein
VYGSGWLKEWVGQPAEYEWPRMGARDVFKLGLEIAAWSATLWLSVPVKSRYDLNITYLTFIPVLACFDLAHAEQGALKTFWDTGVADRCDFFGGDFFEDDLPAGADAHIISTVLHDWGDEDCLKILRNCRRQIPDKGRLLVVEIVLSDEKNVPDTYRNFLDLGMLTGTEGGMERTGFEFRNLLATAGFSLSRILPTKAPQWVIEALPQ